MNRIVRLMQSYLLWSAPFVVACMLWEDLGLDAHGVLYDVISGNLMLWFAVLIAFLALLVLVPGARERALRRLANLKERDEREEYITARASRASYMSMLSVMILFLFLSVLTVRITHYLPGVRSADDGPATVSIDLDVDLWDRPHDATPEPDDVWFQFESHGLPLSKSAIILLFMAWQVVSFNLAARRIGGAG